jgi:hypothetical protein
MPSSFLVGDRIKVDSSSLLGLNDDLSLRTGDPEDGGHPSASEPRGGREVLLRSARPVRNAGWKKCSFTERSSFDFANSSNRASSKEPDAGSNRRVSVE